VKRSKNEPKLCRGEVRHVGMAVAISSLFGIRKTFTLCFGLNLSDFVIAFLKGGFQNGMCGICMLQFDLFNR
jgi:hypothetical protein